MPPASSKYETPNALVTMSNAFVLRNKMHFYWLFFPEFNERERVRDCLFAHGRHARASSWQGGVGSMSQMRGIYTELSSQSRAVVGRSHYSNWHALVSKPQTMTNRVRLLRRPVTLFWVATLLISPLSLKYVLPGQDRSSPDTFSLSFGELQFPLNYDFEKTSLKMGHKIVATTLNITLAFQ